MKLRKMTTLGALAALTFAGAAFAQDKGDQADQNAQQSWSDAKKSANEGSEAAKQKTEQGYDSAKQGTEQAYGAAKQKTEQGYESAKQGTEEAYGSAKQKVAENTQHTVRGTLTRVEKDSLTIRESNGREVSLNRDANTRISTTADEKGLANLQSGSEVRANYRIDKSGDKYAQSVTITARPEANPDKDSGK